MRRPEPSAATTFPIRAEPVPALATLNDAYGKPETNQGKQFILVRDGLPSYGSALLAYNQGLEAPVLTGPKVIGLENLDEISKEFRPYKQLVERLNRTYKFHTRPRAGMKSMEGATCLTHFICSILQLPQAAWRIEAFTAEPGTIARH